MIRENILQETKKILEEGSYDYCEYSGCFDLIAKKKRKEELIVIKVLSNVDSFQEYQSKNLRAIAESLDAFSFLIGYCTRYEKLEDNVIYERFGTPTLTVKTFENILLNNRIPFLYRFRGGMFAKIDPYKLRKARLKKGLSQSQLARMLGITKKSIYEHEASEKFALLEVVEKMEEILETKLIKPVDFENFRKTIMIEPKNRFEQFVAKKLMEIGFYTRIVHQSPFNIIAKEKMIVVSEAEKSKVIKKNLIHLKEFSEKTRKPVLLITEEEENFDLPCLNKNELYEMEKPRDIIKLVKRALIR